LPVARIVLDARAMSRASPRFIPCEYMVEITARTVGRRFLLTPRDELNAGVLAALGRALSRYPVELHAVAFMSNHWHSLVSVPDALALTRFVQHVHSRIARLVHRLYGWDGSVFGKASYIAVGEDAQEGRLRYVLAQGVKEGLVRRCVEWPGVHCARALLMEEALVGRCVERRHERQVRTGGGNGGGREPLRGEVETSFPIDLAPLPVWRGLDAADRLVRVRRLIAEIEAEGRAAHATVAGAAWVRERDPFWKPEAPKPSFAPHIHTESEDVRSEFTNDELAFLHDFDAARQELRRGRVAQLPASCFPPVAPFRTAVSTMLSAARRPRFETETGSLRWR
jgi:REP element-mobilizing transposase RayT